MKITEEEILHLADLSNFSIADSEIANLKSDLENILDYISMLNEVDVANVTPTYQVTDLENVWRDDEIAPQEATPDDLIALAPASLNHQIKVPKVL